MILASSPPVDSGDVGVGIIYLIAIIAIVCVICSGKDD